jgi:hypothetical protein
LQSNVSRGLETTYEEITIATTTSPGPKRQLKLLRGDLFDLQSSDPNVLVILPLANTRRSTSKVAMAQIGTPIAVNGILDVQDVQYLILSV